MRRFVSLAIALPLLLGTLPAQAAGGDRLDVAVDHARILKIPSAAGSIIIGNPAIVDVTVHDSQTLVLTGRSYGVTNVVVLGHDGEVVLDDDVTVTSREEGSVRIYRQAARTTFSCSPRCEPKVTVGDEYGSFNNAVEQFQAVNSMVAADQ